MFVFVDFCNLMLSFDFLWNEEAFLGLFKSEGALSLLAAEMEIPTIKSTFKISSRKQNLPFLVYTQVNICEEDRLELATPLIAMRQFLWVDHDIRSSLHSLPFLCQHLGDLWWTKKQHQHKMWKSLQLIIVQPLRRVANTQALNDTRHAISRDFGNASRVDNAHKLNWKLSYFTSRTETTPIFVPSLEIGYVRQFRIWPKHMQPCISLDFRRGQSR